eukprot:1152069-Pelagomonas_calceolata.AAC.1
MAIRSTLVLDSASSGNKFVGILNRMGMKYFSKLDGTLMVQTLYFKLVQGMLNITCSPGPGSSHSIFFTMIFFWCKDSKSPKITLFGAVGGQEWRFGGQKVGFTPRLIRHMGPNLRF